jgi:uncharacterized protein (DUF2141 family)
MEPTMRKTPLILAAALLASSLTAWAQDVAPAPAAAASAAAVTITRCIDVEVQNVRPQQGLLMLAAYGDAQAYGKQPMAALRAPAGEATTKLQMCGISGSTLAITMFQDLDSDGAMGKNILGMPTEPWGSSGKPGPFGPTWETGKVALDGSPVVVKLSQ